MTSDEGRKLADEAEHWGLEAERAASCVPPEWTHHRRLLHNVATHAGDVDAFLERVQPGMDVLELGCSSGWLTVAMARRGARAVGIDVSERALAIARRYAASVRETLSGSVEYRAADLNALELPAESLDVVAIKGTLHHLARAERVLDVVHEALRPGGLLWVSDTCGEEATSTAAVAGALMFLLPTRVGYGEKARGLVRFGLAAPSRIKASMEAEGSSPCEGAGRGVDWVTAIGRRFDVESRVFAPAVTGYIAHQVALPDALARPLLLGLAAADRALVKVGLLRSSGAVVHARKRARPRS